MNAHNNRKTTFIDLGLIDYQQAWAYQTDLFNETLVVKAENRNLPVRDQKPTDNFLIFCEHPHVFTLGRSGDERNLLIKNDELNAINASYYHVNRGGDITYHGPGQIVVYPVIDLENFFTDIHRYMRTLEGAVIETLNEFKIKAGRIQGLTGVWCNVEHHALAKKICALGVKTSRWVTLHGLAFNVNTDLDYFNYIVPCGIGDKAVTSLEQETGAEQDMVVVKGILKQKIASQFEMLLVNHSVANTLDRKRL